MLSFKGAAAEQSEATTSQEINNTSAEAEAEEAKDKDFVEEAEQEQEQEPETEETAATTTNSATDNLTEEFSSMTVVGKPSAALFSRGFSFPYIMYQYVEDGRRRVSIDFLILGMAKENYRPKVVSNGKTLQLGMVIPSFFADENQLQVANEGDAGFNKQSHKATALEEVVNKITEDIDGD